LSAALSLILVVLVAYLAAHVIFDWLARRYQIVSGAEYVVLGILLGPHVAGFMSEQVVRTLAPFMTLALGWTGAALGMQFFVPRLIQIPVEHYKAAAFESITTFLFVSALMLAAFAWAFDFEYRQVILPAITLGAIATATASSAFANAESHPIVTQLETSARFGGAFAIIAFGLILCIIHVDVNVGERLLTPAEWALICIGIGVVGGALFHLFIGREQNTDRLFIAMAGAIILSSGAAAYLRLSPLLPCFLIGATLVNTSSNRDELRRMMASVEKPMYFALLVLAGAFWSPSRFDWGLPVVLYVFVRVAARLGSARLATRAVGFDVLRGSNWGTGLLAQGTIGLAIAMSYSLNDVEIVPNVVFTAAVFSVLISDIFGMRITALLVRESN
jgi:Kef-type K+ transport system membrane component KefB